MQFMVGKMKAPAGTCRFCHNGHHPVSTVLGICGTCLVERGAEFRPDLEEIHATLRSSSGLPGRPARNTNGVLCGLCGNRCVLQENEIGFCGLRTVYGGRLVHLAGTPKRGVFGWYLDPLPNNCSASWVCDGSRNPGYHSLAIHYNSCTADCLFCRNGALTDKSSGERVTLSAEDMAGAATLRTFCVSFMGGDPASQMPHALAAARLLSRRGVRVCWETMGTMHPKLLEPAVRYSLRSGGCLKYDLKAFDEDLHLGLTGISNTQALENFTRVAHHFHERPSPPLVVASTSLVPGYVEAGQIGKIAGFIASLEPSIPYVIQGFFPQSYMTDLPRATKALALEAEAAAREAGLINVRIGNRHLLK